MAANSEPAKILRDQPSDKDQFQGEGHKRSATALAFAVEQLADKDGAIGLEGRWGSGKSTVISLAAKLFSNRSETKHHFFTFDLWLHHPDILKLAFLEEFISWAAGKNFISENEARNYVERISDREVTTRIENKRELSFHGLVFVLVAPLLPIAYAWLTPLIFAQNSRAGATLFSIGSLAMSGPGIALFVVSAGYLVFLSAIAVTLVRRREKTLKAAWSAAARIFSRETDHDKIKQTIRERNPTNEEFQSFFREVLSNVQRKGVRVVFVFDNIDRLPADIVAQVWSDTRAIFSMRSHGTQPSNSAVTAIVPYDAAYIADAFKGDAESTNGSRAEHLIRKTFDISIRVAPPLSTDWRKFLETKLDEAFPESIGEDDKYRIFKLFDIDHQDRSLFPTPRNVISYVNDVASIWNQWGEIPLSHIALYVLRRQDIERNPAILRTGEGISSRQTRVVGGEDWPRSLAALHFNVEPQHAYQILLGQDIERVATSADSAEFVSLAQSSGFTEVFPDTIETRVEKWAEEGPELLAALASNMTSPSLKGDFVRETWWRIAGAFDRLGHCETNSAVRYIGLALVVERLSPTAAKTRSRQLVDWFASHLPDQPSFESGENWFQFFASVHDALGRVAGKEQALAFVKATPLPQGQIFSLGVCAAAARHKTIDYDHFGRADSAETLSELALDLSRTNPATLVEILREPPWFASESFWQQLTERVCQRIQTEQLSQDVRENLIDVLADIRSYDWRTDSSRQRVAQLANDGSLVVQAVRANSDGDETTSARAIWLILDSSGGSHPPTNPGSHPQFGDLGGSFQSYGELVAHLDVGSISEIARLVAATGAFVEWMNWAIARPETQLFANVLGGTVDRGQLGALQTREIARQFRALEQILGPERTQNFLKQFAGYSEHFQKHFSGQESLKISTRLLATIGRSSSSRLATLSKFVDDYFDGLPEPEWDELLTGADDEALDHLLVQIEHGYHPPLGPYFQALMKKTMEVLDGDSTIEQHRERWNLLYRGIQPNTRDRFARDVLINLQRVTTTPASVELFLATNAELAADLPLVQEAEVSLDQIATTIVSAPSDAGLAFLRARAADFVECRKKAKGEVDGRLVEALSALKQRGDEANAEDLARLLGVKLVQPKDSGSP